MPTQLILLNNQVAIDHICAAGAPQLILAPGNGFTGSHLWTQMMGANDAPSSQFLNKLVDPLRNTAIDIHEYLDIDFSGSHDECTQPAPSNLANLMTWLQENHFKAMISEFRGGNNENCFQFIDTMLDYLPLTFWGTSAPCCGADTGSLEPGQLNDLGQPDAFTTMWANSVRPNIPKNLKRNGVSSLS
ncbi:glycoside hydrolase superfamily [Gymnopilus junonius]|uniref:cellulase n=1 Tax=Gymnopilus junonius TaxID=109634 RepID=A0A9P5TJT3_GYMJU|nr:glycoside hydrolase superfamily [Gymnopilus junonius]